MNIIEQQPRWGLNYREGFDGFTVRRKDFIAAGIRWFEKWDMLPGVPPVSHTFKIIGDNRTIEAFSDGIHYGTIGAYLNDPDVALLVREPIVWTQDMAEKMTAAAAAHLGDKYGTSLIAAMAFTRTFFGRGLDWLSRGWTTRFVTNMLDSKRQEICSELVAMVDREQPELACAKVFAYNSNEITPLMLFGDDTLYKPGAIELVP